LVLTTGIPDIKYQKVKQAFQKKDTAPTVFVFNTVRCSSLRTLYIPGVGRSLLGFKINNRGVQPPGMKPMKYQDLMY